MPLLIIILICSTGHVFQIHLEQFPAHSGRDLHCNDSGYAPGANRNPARDRAGACKGEHSYQTCKIRILVNTHSQMSPCDVFVWVASVYIIF